MSIFRFDILSLLKNVIKIPMSSEFESNCRLNSGWQLLVNRYLEKRKKKLRIACLFSTFLTLSRVPTVHTTLRTLYDRLVWGNRITVLLPVSNFGGNPPLPLHSNC